MNGFDGLRSDNRAHAFRVSLFVGFLGRTLLEVLQHFLIKFMKVILDDFIRNVLLVLDPWVRKEQLLWMLTYIDGTYGNLNYHHHDQNYIKKSLNEKARK